MTRSVNLPSYQLNLTLLRVYEKSLNHVSPNRTGAAVNITRAKFSPPIQPTSLVQVPRCEQYISYFSLRKHSLLYLKGLIV
jgi:hypothetical protein